MVRRISNLSRLLETAAGANVGGHEPEAFRGRRSGRGRSARSWNRSVERTHPHRKEDPVSLYMLSVTLHVFAALLWLGGMFFLAAVGAPVLRAVEPPALRAEMFRRLGVAFRNVGWIAIGVLLVTGFGNLYFRGLLRYDLWANPQFWSSGYGHTLAWKLATVAIMVVISFLHDFVYGPRSARLQPGSAAALASRRRSAWMARANALVGVVLVIVAVRLARGG
jgi:copper resistance protein D